jgi:hypothetical protein
MSRHPETWWAHEPRCGAGHVRRPDGAAIIALVIRFWLLPFGTLVVLPAMVWVLSRRRRR